ncbi:MAG: N-acetyltransferase [Bacteroidales bacterium]|nr:N-acetyltransferase [Bacteroidales bacterium]
MITIKLEDKGNKGRFVLYEDNTQAGEVTFYSDGENKIVLDHTGVDQQFGGKGYAKQLVMKVVEYARENNLKIVPVCSYAKRVFDRDESLNDLRES